MLFEHILFSIGFLGVGVIVFFGVKMVIKPPRTKPEFLKRHIPLLVALVMLAPALVVIYFRQHSATDFSLGGYLGTASVSSVRCDYTWKKTYDGETLIDREKDIRTTDVAFSYTDYQAFKSTIVFTSGTMTAEYQKNLCEHYNHGTFAIKSSSFEGKPVDLMLCDAPVQIDMASGIFSYTLKGVPIMIGVITKKVQIEQMLNEASCILSRLPISTSPTVQAT